MNRDGLGELRRVIELCARLRGVDCLLHRAIYEFGWFLQEMERFLVYGEFSKDRDLARFQSMLKDVRESFNPEDVETYVRLFEFYCLWYYGFWIPFRERRARTVATVVPTWFFDSGEEVHQR